MSIILSIGRWGGFYCNHGRLCLGWIAFTLMIGEFDDWLERKLDEDGV
jgi:hypothetical protein